MMKRFLPFIALMTVMSFFSCKRETKPDYGIYATRDYNPLRLGAYIIYDVDSTIWNDFDSSKTVRHCQIRYTYTDTFRDNQDMLSYQVDVMTRPDANSAQWVTNDVFFVTPTETGLEVIQNNLRIQKLAFPVENGKTWKGNSKIAVNDADLNFYADWDYVYSKMGESYNNGRVNYNSTVIVDAVDYARNDPEADPTHFAERTYGREVYAYDIGMIYREMLHWTYDQNGSGHYARKGWGVTMRAVDHN